MAQTEDILNCKWKKSFQTISRREGWTQKMCLQTNMTKSFTRKTVRLCYYPEITSRITRLILRLNAGFPIVGAWGGVPRVPPPSYYFFTPTPPPLFKGRLSGLRQFLATESPSKIMKKCFLFHLFVPSIY